MKTTYDFLEKDWTFSRALRVSIKFAFIYAVLSVAWILIFGNKPEISFKLNLLDIICTDYILPWDSWYNIFPNFLGIILAGIAIFGIYKILQFLSYGFDIEIWNFGLEAGFFLGIVLGLVGLSSGVGGIILALIFALIGGLYLWVITGERMYFFGSGLGFLISFLFFTLKLGLGYFLVSVLITILIYSLASALFLLILFLIESFFSEKFWKFIREKSVFCCKQLIK